MKNKDIVYHLNDLPKLVVDLAKEFKNFPIIALKGDLGAGKTTLVKSLLNEWGVKDEVLSPTFTYVNCYKNDSGERFCHFDLYRIETLQQFLSLGFDEYLADSEIRCIVEWPQVIERLIESLPVINITIEHALGETRRLIIEQ